MTSTHLFGKATLAVALLGTAVSSSGDAQACGGLFCNAAQPVNQAAERIIFASNDDGTVTAVIEIQYEGPSEEFAWVLPVPPGETEVGVGSTISLDRIEAQSNPSYFLQVVFDEACGAVTPAPNSPVTPGATPPMASGDVLVDESGVVVVASGSAGPYDYEQIAVDPDLDDPAQVAVDWLVDNGYDVGELGPDVLRPYLEQDMNLLAFRLTKGSDTGSIRPIRLSYESDQPFIPLRPTAVAANPDMGIKVWVLGDSRAIPQNYLHLELNEARIDWFNPNGTYNDVVIAAADEAGGQGFVTEMAGPAGNFAEAAYQTWEQYNWENLRTGQFGSLDAFFQTAVYSFGSYDGFIDVMSDPETVPLREGATPEQFITCPYCYFQADVAVRNDAYPSTPYDPATDPLNDIDISQFLSEMDRLVVSPLADTRTLFEENSTVTRFYTTMSADEMTADPAFDFNPDLEDVSNAHQATQIMQCNGESEWRIEFDSGIAITGDGRTWPVEADSEMAYNLRVVQLSTSGEGDVIDDNAAAVGALLADLGIGEFDEEAAVDDDEPTTTATDEDEDEESDDSEPSTEDDTDADDGESDEDVSSEADDSDGGGGCSVASTGNGPTSMAWLGLLGLSLLLRRRKGKIGKVNALLAFAGVLTFLGDDAEACGGLFCDAAQPVNQAAERIIFAQNDDGTVTGVIEIQYEGPSEEFAWVLPVPPGETEVGVGSQISLDRIEAQSNPTYTLRQVLAPECINDSLASDDSAQDPTTSAPPSPEEPREPGVEVVASGTAGPYDYEQIAVDPDLDDPAQVAVDWLLDNGYDVGELGPDVLRPYLEEGLNLLAFRLTKGNDAGSIRPIRLTYESEQPFIPLRPTAVAANPDMGIKVWVLGNSRAIPSNYLHLELNEARIDWFNPNSTYNDVIIAAADEAGGQGFVTEQAGPASAFAEAAYQRWEAENWETLRTGQFSSLQEFLQLAVNVFGSYDGFIDLLGDPETVPLREGATAEQFLACLDCYFEVDVAVRNEAYPSTPYDPGTDPLNDLNVATFLSEMDRLVISPLADTRTLFEENSTVTRFYTTMSADEMTADPAFDFNPELEDVSNAHIAEQVLQCTGDTEWRIEFDTGIVVEGNGRTWPVLEDSDIPFNLRVLQLSTSGAGDVIEDNTAEVGQLLADLGIGSGPEDIATPDDTQDDDPAEDEPNPDDPVAEETDVEEATDGSETTDSQATDAESTDEDAEPSDEATDEEPTNETDAATDDVNVEDDVADGGDDGCGCSVVGQARQAGGLSWLGLLGIALLARRRRSVTRL